MCLLLPKQSRINFLCLNFPTDIHLNQLYSMSCLNARWWLTFFATIIVYKALLKRAIIAAGKKTLVHVAPSWWGSLIGMARSHHDAKEVLYHLVASRDFVAGTATQKADTQALVDINTKAGLVSFLLEKNTQ